MFNYSINEIIQGGNITNNDDCKFDSKVYFLIKDGQVIYVGQTKRFASRISQHSDKDFDNVSFICVPEHALSDVEAHYIVKLNPELNKSIPGNSFFTTKGNIKSVVRSMVNEMIMDMEVVYKSKGRFKNQQEFCLTSDAASFIKDLSKKIGVDPSEYVKKIKSGGE